MSVSAKEAQIEATLEEPVPVLGLQSQHLGYVQRLQMRLDNGRIATLELQTRWQKIRLHGDDLRFDRNRGVFYLRPTTRLA